jgi:hypothetical protein
MLAVSEADESTRKEDVDVLDFDGVKSLTRYAERLDRSAAYAKRLGCRAAADTALGHFFLNGQYGAIDDVRRSTELGQHAGSVSRTELPDERTAGAHASDSVLATAGATRPASLCMEVVECTHRSIIASSLTLVTSPASFTTFPSRKHVATPSFSRPMPNDLSRSMWS